MRSILFARTSGPWIQQAIRNPTAYLYRPLATMTTSETQESQPAAAIKLHGRAFYESIGSPKYIIAPMVDQSEFVSL